MGLSEPCAHDHRLSDSNIRCHRIVGADSLHRDGDSRVSLARFATDMATACRMESPREIHQAERRFQAVLSRTPSPSLSFQPASSSSCTA